jgi:hypothetical protein
VRRVAHLQCVPPVSLAGLCSPQQEQLIVDKPNLPPLEGRDGLNG